MDLDCDAVLEPEFDALSLSVAGSDVASRGVKYSAKLHARRVAAELAVDDGLVYLAGQPEVELEDSDQPQPFRQRRYFFYLSGANLPDCHVTYEIAADRLTLWIPHVEPRQVLWFGSRPSAARCRRLYDVDKVYYASQLPKFAPDAGPHAASRVDHVLLRPAMDRALVVKTDYEVAMVRRANDISSAAHRRVAELLLRLTNERDIEAVFQAVCTAHGTRSQAYPIIAAASTNASTLHYDANDQPLSGRDVVVLDAGCEWDCYANDITRTLPLSGSFPPKAAAVHAIVHRMQQECIARVRPGAVLYELQLHGAAVALDGLRRLSILKGSAGEIARAGTVAAFFPHGMGHHVGLEVHDVYGGSEGKRDMVTPAALAAMADDARRSSVSERRRQGLRPNMIITIEPGIYFCREYLEGYFLSDPAHARFIDADVLKDYYTVGGVRIEDCILVTPEGHENLTTAPKGDALLDVINHRGAKAGRLTGDWGSSSWPTWLQASLDADGEKRWK